MINASSVVVAGLLGAVGGVIAAGVLGKKDNQELGIAAAIGVAAGLTVVLGAEAAGRAQDPNSASILKGIKELREAVADEDDAGKASAIKRIAVSLQKIDPTIDI